MDIFVKAVSVLMFVLAVCCMIFAYILPIHRMKQRANGEVLFQNKKNIKFWVVILFSFYAVMIVFIFIAKNISALNIVILYPIIFFPQMTFAKSDKEIFIQGQVIRIEDIEEFSYKRRKKGQHMLHLKYKKHRPLDFYISRETELFFSDIEADFNNKILNNI